MKTFAKEPGDEAYMATPLRVPRSSPFLHRWISLMRETLFGDQPVKGFDHNIFMHALKESVDHFGLNDACVPTCTFSPLPYHLGQQVLSAKSVRIMKPAKSIMDEAFGVNAFWQSSRGKKPIVGIARGSHRRAERGSVWSNLLLITEEKMNETTREVEDDAGPRVVKRRYREKPQSPSWKLFRRSLGRSARSACRQ